MSRDFVDCCDALIGVYVCVCTSEFIFYLDASEEFLKARVKSLPESLIQEQDYQQEAFLQRLATFRMNRLKNETTLEYFEEIDVAPVLLGNSTPEYFFHNVFISSCLSSEET